MQFLASRARRIAAVLVVAAAIAAAALAGTAQAGTVYVALDGGYTSNAGVWCHNVNTGGTGYTTAPGGVAACWFPDGTLASFWASNVAGCTYYSWAGGNYWIGGGATVVHIGLTGASRICG